MPRDVVEARVRATIDAECFSLLRSALPLTAAPLNCLAHLAARPLDPSVYPSQFAAGAALRNCDHNMYSKLYASSANSIFVYCFNDVSPATVMFPWAMLAENDPSQQSRGA